MHNLYSGKFIELTYQYVSRPTIESKVKTSCADDRWLKIEVTARQKSGVFFVSFSAAFSTFEEMVQAIREEQVDGLLVDRYSGYYYLKESNLTDIPLMTTSHIEMSASIGIAFAPGTDALRGCLETFKAEVKKPLQSTISGYKASCEPGNLLL